MHLLGFLRFMVILVNDLATVGGIASDSEMRYVPPACVAALRKDRRTTATQGTLATVTSAR